MVTWIQVANSVVGLLLAAAAGVYVARDRLTDRVLLAIAGLLTVGLVAQLVTSFVLVLTEDNDANPVTFLAYLVGCVAAMPVAAWWARGEPSRAGTAVWIVVGLVLPFLLLRASQVWDAGAL